MNQHTGNLILNPEDPFGKYIPSDENDIHKILSGSVYQDNWDKFMNNEDDDEDSDNE